MFKKKEKISTSKKVSISKNEYYQNKNKNKKSRWKRLKEYIRLLNFRNLNTEIKKYGFNYSLRKYIIYIIILMGIVVLSSYFFKLRVSYTLFLGFWAIFLLPFIILSQIKFLHNNQKFEELITYLTETIMVFETSPKIIYALKEVSSLFESHQKMKKDILKAVNYIEYSNGGEQVYAKGLEIIEEEYPCSRVKSLHRLMLTVENQNSQEYFNALNDLYEDVSEWIKRTYTYQLDLKHLRNQFNIVIALTIFVAVLMVNVLPDILTGFIVSPIYQFLTLIMLGSFLLMFAIVQARLNGQWLINDIEKDDGKILRSIKIIESYNEKSKRKDSMIKGLIALAVPITGILINNQNIIMLGGIIVVIMLCWNTFEYKSAFSTVKKEIEKNYPIWLRDVSLNMHNLVVTRALKQSLVTAPTVIHYYLEGFIEEIEKDPISIKPYNDFLKKFYISDISSSMKSLYSIKQNSSSEASKKISDLIVRNQDMMKKSEEIRNKNQLTGITLLGYLPMVIGCGKMIIDMIMMLLYFMSNMMTF